MLLRPAKPSTSAFNPTASFQLCEVACLRHIYCIYSSDDIIGVRECRVAQAKFKIAQKIFCKFPMGLTKLLEFCIVCIN